MVSSPIFPSALSMSRTLARKISSLRAIGQEFEMDSGHDVEGAGLCEESVRDQCVDVDMEAVRILSKRLDGHDHAWDTGRKPHGVSQENEQDRNGEDILSMWDWVENALAKTISKLNDLLGVTGGAEPSPLAAEQVLN